MSGPLEILRGTRRRVLPLEQIFHFANEVEASSHPFDELLLFPALFRKDHQLSLPVATINDPEIRCFYNEAKPAQYLCQQSGRYISADYAVEWQDKVVCAEYLQSLQEQDKSEVKQEFPRYDVIALNTAVIGVFVYFLMVFTAPVAFFLSIAKWKSLQDHPLSPKRWRFVVAFIISLLQLIVIALFFLLIVYGIWGKES